jgi:hypothetical protein
MKTRMMCEDVGHRDKAKDDSEDDVNLDSKHSGGNYTETKLYFCCS